MVHDLTANEDFQKTRGLGVLTIPIKDEDVLTPPYEEVVLTGTTYDRDIKRYVLDKNMCHCCGAFIRIRPWDFKENKTLCPDCEKWLEENYNSKEDGSLLEDSSLLEEVVDDRFSVRVVKPWDIRDFERENVVDNILLWD